MKKSILLSLLFLLLLTSPTFAQTPTIGPTISPATTITDSKKNDSLTEKINDLKDKIASRVAQLKLVEKRGVIGEVTEASATQITIKDLNGLVRSIDVDEITKFSSPGKSDFGISDIEKGKFIGAVGIYNKQSKRILARFVDVINLPEILNGVITKVDEKEFTVNIATEDKKNYLVDIEKITKTNSYTKDGGIKKSGFSDILIGQRAIVTGYKDKNEKDRVTATRILLFPEYPKNPKIDVNITPEPNREPTTNTKSKITPSPTKKTTK